MKHLSLRGFDAEMERRIREIARKEGISLNRAALLLLRRGSGLDRSRKSSEVVGTTLDHLIGKWSSEEEADFLKGIAPLEKIDRAFWK